MWHYDLMRRWKMRYVMKQVFLAILLAFGFVAGAQNVTVRKPKKQKPATTHVAPKKQKQSPVTQKKHKDSHPEDKKEDKKKGKNEEKNKAEKNRLLHCQNKSHLLLSGHHQRLPLYAERRLLVMMSHSVAMCRRHCYRLMVCQMELRVELAF